MPDDQEEQHQNRQHDWLLSLWQPLADYHADLRPTRYDSTWSEGDDLIRAVIHVTFRGGGNEASGTVLVGESYDAAADAPVVAGPWLLEQIPEGGTPAADFRTVRDKYILDVNTGNFWGNATGPWVRRGYVLVETFISPIVDPIEHTLLHLLPE